jgi:DNA polymerase-1
VWDGAGKTWRHQFSEVYKANRQGPKNPEVEKMHRQLPILYKLLTSIGVRQYVVDQLECDDLIGILSKFIIRENLFDEVVIYSNDKDFYQLHSKRIRIAGGNFMASSRDAPRFIDDVYVLRKFGVRLKNWLTYRAITGDPSDNIPGAKRGVGPVGAKKLIAQGLDAGVPSFDQLDKASRKTFADWQTAWPALHRNFILSNIARTPMHGMLPPEISRELLLLLTDLGRSSFLRDTSRRSEKSFRQFTDFLVDYDMLDILAKRRAIWSLR